MIRIVFLHLGAEYDLKITIYNFKLFLKHFVGTLTIDNLTKIDWKIEGICLTLETLREILSVKSDAFFLRNSVQLAK